MSRYKFKDGLMINKKTGISVSTTNESDTEPQEKDLVDIIMGKQPKNSYQEALQKQIKAIEDVGSSVELPSV